MTTWDRIELIRSKTAHHPTTSPLFDGFVELHGDRLGTIRPSWGIRYRGTPVTVIGQVKGRNLRRTSGPTSRPIPKWYRKALRLMRQAEKFRH